ncbi:hypothetical protein BTE56_04790 [Agrobacterium pusense]|nr:hypothetical protein BTE56_04790 [Agrobacterium pusense]SDE61604.1 hypothetical protein SAMN05421750_102531 [Agrobacterium pusense]
MDDEAQYKTALLILVEKSYVENARGYCRHITREAPSETERNVKYVLTLFLDYYVVKCGNKIANFFRSTVNKHPVRVLQPDALDIER